jgi:iron-sulfur cluster repair protein YtfE (RIC family)
MTEINQSTLIGDIIRHSPLAFRVLAQHGIHFGLQLIDRSLQEACDVFNAPLDQVVIDLTEISMPGKENLIDNPEQMETRALLRLLHQNHHEFVSELFPYIELLLTQLHKQPLPEKEQIQQLMEVFLSLKADFTRHVMEETEELFPYIEKLNRIVEGKYLKSEVNDILNHGKSGSMVENDCDIHQYILRLRLLADQFESKAHHSLVQRSLYRAFIELESKLYRHEYLEYEILLRHILKLENQAFHHRKA